MLERKEKSFLGSDTREQQSREVPVQSSGRESVRESGRERQRGESSYPMSQMDRLFDEVFKRPFFSLWSHRMGEEETGQQLFVPMDVFEDGESVIVKAELPGMRKEDINVQLTPDTITISGEKRSEQRVKEENFFRCESSYGSFTRSCQLPAEILTDRARAVFKDGILEVRIPKSMETRERAKQITIE